MIHLQKILDTTIKYHSARSSIQARAGANHSIRIEFRAGESIECLSCPNAARHWPDRHSASQERRRVPLPHVPLPKAAATKHPHEGQYF
jgi:hypothetical protein